MVQVQLFLKGGGWGAGTFPVNFFQGLSFLHFQITLSFAKCIVMHSKKKKIFCYHNFMKKVIQSCLKMTLKISHKLR